MAQDKMYVDDQGKEFPRIKLTKVDDQKEVMNQLVAIDSDEDRIEKWGEQQIAHLFSSYSIAMQLPQGAGSLLAYVFSEVCHFDEIQHPADMAETLFNELPANIIHGINMNFFGEHPAPASPSQEVK